MKLGRVRGITNLREVYIVIGLDKAVLSGYFLINIYYRDQDATLVLAQTLDNKRGFKASHLLERSS